MWQYLLEMFWVLDEIQSPDMLVTSVHVQAEFITLPHVESKKSFFPRFFPLISLLTASRLSLILRPCLTRFWSFFQCFLFSNFRRILHFFPLPTDELKQFFLCRCTDMFLCTFCRNPKPTFTQMWALRMGNAFFALHFSNTELLCCIGEAVQVWFRNRSVSWNSSTTTP